MERSYKIIRTNSEEGTVTVLLQAAGHTLQQDIPLTKNMTAVEFRAEVEIHLTKLEEDMDAADKSKVMIDPTLQELLDTHTFQRDN